MTERRTDSPVEPLFLERWSPRAFDGSAMPAADLRTLFDAARWAPSAYNVQPWRFLFAHRDGPDWARFLDLLVPANQGWAKDASVLLFVLSDTLLHGDDPARAKPSHTHSFDAGAAWALLALQATRLGYFTHGMSGVDFDRARIELAVPERYRVECAVAVGRQGDAARLPEPLRDKERPSDRDPVDRFAFPGSFPG